MERLLENLKRKIQLIIGRAVLLAVNNSTKTQGVQISLLADEISSDVERFQEYGFETYPLAGAEALALHVSGNRDEGVVITIHDNRYRPTDLKSGEVKVYTYKDNLPMQLPHQIHFVVADQSINIYGLKVRIGNGTVELLSLIDTLIGQLQIATTMTALGPQPLDAVTQGILAGIQNSLAQIKG